MAYRLFEGKKHAAIYQKYRFTPPEEVKDVIIQYLDKKKGPPHGFAVDMGCGTGLFTRLLAPHFKEVVGIDVSECQVEEARATPGYPNITYRRGTAEDLPFEDCTVDLLTAASAAHWFDQEKFLAEVNRVLKPGGCIGLLGVSELNLKFTYKSCGDKITQIYREVKQLLLPYTANRVSVSESKLDAMYAAIPFPDKNRIESIPAKTLIPVNKLVGFIRSWSMFQTYETADPQGAEDLLANTQKRILDEMGVTSPETEIEREWEYFCILASKPLQQESWVNALSDIRNVAAHNPLT